MRYFILLGLMFSTFMMAETYEQGEKLFAQKCSSCHSGYIAADKIKENFFEKNNTLLKLTTPTANMLAYAIMRSSRHIGDPSDPEMQQAEIEEYLISALYHPKREDSICDPEILKYYDTKPRFSEHLEDEEIAALAQYFMGYRQHRTMRKPHTVKKMTPTYNATHILAEAQKLHKRILVEASTKTCHFCKKMKREVIGTEAVQKLLHQGYVMVEVDVDEHTLPFDLERHYKHITPSFFILESNGTFVASYPGSWKKRDFVIILNEHMPGRSQ